MLMKMTSASACDIGGPKEAVDESDAVDMVRDEDPEELGGERGPANGIDWPDET